MELSHVAHFAPTVTAWCGTSDPIAFAGIVVGLFATALVGGFAHCAPMCGPFVLMQVTEQERRGLQVRRLAAGALLPYHLGRLTTYTALGIAAGGLGGSLTTMMPLRWFATALLGLAALAFLLQGINGVARWLPGRGVRRAEAWLAGGFARLATPLLRPGVGLSGYRLGLVLGLLPCGFLYGALLAATATGGALAGALAMSAFALGTVPALVAAGILGAGLLQRWRGAATALATPIFLFNAVTLGGLALRLVA